MGMTVGWLQLDYQESDVREPVVIAPTPTDFLVPVLQTLAVKDNNRSVTDIVSSFDFIDLSFAEFDFTVEERLIFDIFGFFDSVSYRKGVRLQAQAGLEREECARASYGSQSLMKTANSAFDTPTLQSLLETDFSERNKTQGKTYIKQLYLGAVKVNLSYSRGKKSASEGQGEKRLGHQVINFAGGEYMLEQLDFSRERSDVFQAWRQHTYDEERHAEEEGKMSVVLRFNP